MTKAKNTKATATTTTAPVSVGTARMDAMLSGLLLTLEGSADRWLIEGWAGHIRPSNHQIHAANSWAKHRTEFGSMFLYDLARLLTVARMIDFGMTGDEAINLLNARVTAKAEKDSTQP